MKSPLPPIDIVWVDPTSDNGWMTIEQARTIVLQSMLARGWLVNEDKDYIRISTNVSQDGDRVSDVLVLPKGCIVRRKGGNKTRPPI